jgi:predicted NAD/FAD-dependent oxidoreductase
MFLQINKSNRTILNFLLASSYIHPPSNAFSASSSPSPPSFKVCILGGGIAGCSAVKSLCETTTSSSVALIEMGRGLGGRCSTRLSRENDRIQINHGAPKADVHTKDGVDIMKTLEANGFARRLSESKYWQGTPNMSSLCLGLVNNLTPKPTYLFQIMVRAIEPSISNGKVANWTLRDKDDNIILTTDWLVISGSAMAHPRWTTAFGGEPPLVMAAKKINNKELDDAILTIEAIGAKPVHVTMMSFDKNEGWKSISSDISIIETPDDAVLEKLVIQNSPDGSHVSVVAHSNMEFASSAINVHGSKSTAAKITGANSSAHREQEVLSALMESTNAQLKKIIGDNSLVPSWGPFLHRWGNAFPTGTALPLERAVITDAKIAFCGDYVGERFGTIEGALLSGMHVGQEVGQFLA